MLIIKKTKSFKNGEVFLLNTEDGFPIETTDTFLPYYTKDAVGRKQNCLVANQLGSREERWMIGVSVMSGCPVGCKFCATGNLKKWRNLSAIEMVEQVQFVISRNATVNPSISREFKINWTRMGEPFLNIKEVRKAMGIISELYPNTHHYVSTVGVKNADYSWICGNTTLQLSVHSFDEDYRNWLIPFKGKVSLETLGHIRTKSNLKTTVNLTMAREQDFDITAMKRIFSKENFFIKISPINENNISVANSMGEGIIKQKNIM